jgi:phosphoglycerol transferase MdoB-like AlkP superfamily enzyme
MKKLKLPRYVLWLTLNLVIFVLLMTLLRMCLVISFGIPSSEKNGLWKAFVLGMRYDLRIVSVYVLILFLLALVPGLHPLQKKWGQWIAFLLLFIFTLLLTFFYMVDFANYAYLHQRINGSILNYLDDAKISMGMVWQTYPVIWIMLALLGVVFLIIGMLKLAYNFTLSKNKYATKTSRVIWSVALFLFLAFGIFGRVGQYPLRWSDAFSIGSDYAANIALNPFQAFFSSLNFRRASFEKEKVKAAYPVIAGYIGKTNSDTLDYARTITGTHSGNKPNIVLIICESFSAFKSSRFGNPLNTTPFFDSLSREGLFFSNCFTPTYGTAKGVWAAITGVPDVQLYKTASRNPAAVDQHTIINDFKGYEKFYFLGGSTSWANIRGLLTNNIDGLHLYEEGSYTAAKIDVWGISDKNLFLEANKVLTKQTKPFFAVIQTADNHRPYTIPEEDKNTFKKANEKTATLNKYGFESNDELNAFRYADFSYSKFIEAAKASPYFKNTIFLFIGDHGIRGDAGNLLPKAFTSMGLTSEHVPMLIYAPGKTLKGDYNGIASQVDVLPTLAGLSNIKYTNTSLGRDLLSVKDTSTNCAFIIDAENKRIGIVNKGLYYSYGLNNLSPEQFGNIRNNEPVNVTDSLKKHYRTMTDAFYETARYLLLNNKKKQRP